MNKEHLPSRQTEDMVANKGFVQLCRALRLVVRSSCDLFDKINHMIYLSQLQLFAETNEHRTTSRKALLSRVFLYLSYLDKLIIIIL